MQTKDRSETQSEKFKRVAKELECDDDEQRFKERLKIIVKQKPVEKDGN
jgi:hypothetical protein|tara:strand:- start:700 stop:846 length:147 start_codon:yes stop_codon:yes gene_type:complete